MYLCIMSIRDLEYYSTTLCSDIISDQFKWFSGHFS